MRPKLKLVIICNIQIGYKVDNTTGKAVLSVWYGKLVSAQPTFTGAMCRTEHLVGDNFSCQWLDQLEMAVKQDCRQLGVTSPKTDYSLTSSANNLTVTPVGITSQISLI